MSILLGAVGPLLLTPVTIWLDSHRHGLSTDMQWESVFRWLWPTSLMFMTGGGPKSFALAYIIQLLSIGLANVVFFGLLGAVLGVGIKLIKLVFRLSPLAK